MKLLVRTMTPRKTHAGVIPESNRADQCDTTLGKYHDEVATYKITH